MRGGQRSGISVRTDLYWHQGRLLSATAMQHGSISLVTRSPPAMISEITAFLLGPPYHTCRPRLLPWPTRLTEVALPAPPNPLIPYRPPPTDANGCPVPLRRTPPPSPHGVLPLLQPDHQAAVILFEFGKVISMPPNFAHSAISAFLRSQTFGMLGRRLVVFPPP